MDYLKILNEGYESCSQHGPLCSRLEYIGSYIFNFVTYESEVCELMAKKL